MKAVGIPVRGWLPDLLREFLESRTPRVHIDSRTFDILADADATRHVIVHSPGIVDEAYRRRVRNSPFELGERRTVAAVDIDVFSGAITRVARAIRDTDQNSTVT